MGPPTLRYQEIGWGHPLSGTKRLDGATHSPVPRKCGWPPSSRPPSSPLSGTKEMWMAPFVPRLDAEEQAQIDSEWGLKPPEEKPLD